MSTLLMYIGAGIAFQYAVRISTRQEFPWWDLVGIALWPISIMLNICFWSYRLVKFLTKRGERKGE